MARTFISYRRDDSAGHAGRLYDQLRGRLGRQQVFIDIASIQPGQDFVEVIDSAVSSFDCVLVIIGRRWLSGADSDGVRRIDRPDDFVRLEVARALARNIRVIPVLVQGASMPTAAELPDDLASLARRNAIELSDVRWDYDVGRLVAALQQMPGSVGPGVARLRTRWSDRKPLVFGAAALVGVVGLAAGLMARNPGSPPEGPTPVATPVAGAFSPTPPPAAAVQGQSIAPAGTPTSAPTVTPAPIASSTPTPPPATSVPSPPPTPAAPAKGAAAPPRSISAGQWTFQYRVLGNECPFGPRADTVQTFAFTFEPRAGSVPYILAGDQFMFIESNGTRWGPFTLTWPKLDLTLPDDDHDHVHYVFEFGGPTTASSSAILHQIKNPECRIRFST